MQYDNGPAMLVLALTTPNGLNNSELNTAPVSLSLSQIEPTY